MPAQTRPLEPVTGDAVVLVNELVRLAVAQRASDIHLEPKEEMMHVRMRVDGALVDVQPISVAVAAHVVSRVKVLAKMDIAERRLPQDGQIALDLEPTGHAPSAADRAARPARVHLRASTFPSSQGEKVVLRILSSQQIIPFGQLGLEADAQTVLRDVLTRPQGFVVTSGPTGAGKTSTLYALMQLIDPRQVNVVTLEDPIEVELPGLTQGQVNVRTGFTFATGLRAILRQDPDVILVGEMRDSETAGIAMQAALTGHLVLSTLHTSDTVETIVRLVDLGVEPWIVANALSAVLAQRLVRVACPHCRVRDKLERDLWDGDDLLMPAGSDIMRTEGCDRCMRTGYRGRTGIFEVVEFDDDLRDLVKAKAPARAYREIYLRRRIPSLRRMGMSKIQSGVTTVAEVLRVT
ncbi:MAG TPA: GspE/PulE family protein [Polyangiaceae bacterium]|jgi:general secretion pathway protein E/type IV pilus assembly protein PilB